MRARIGAICVALLLLTALVAAQVGQIAGTVRDTAGNVLPGVTVQVTSPALIEKSRLTTTDAKGRYAITQLPVGTYEVIFSLQGFTTEKRPAIQVTSDFTAVVNAEMRVSPTQQDVSVLAEAPVVDVQNSRVQQVFQGSEIAELPTTRDLPGILQMVPGTSANQGRVMVDGMALNPGTGAASTMSGSLGESTTGGAAINIVTRTGAIASTPHPGVVVGSVATPDLESYKAAPEHLFRRVADEPLSTFSIDVDTAAYANVRRFLNDGQLPPPAAVRVEEMINYFRYDYAQPKGDVPFSVTTELAESPWNPRHRLVLVGLQGREIDDDGRTPRNLVFLLDVSGSMTSPDKLPLVRNAMRMLVDVLEPRDRVAIVVYAGQSGVALPSTTGDRKEVIHEAIARLQAGGSTNGGAGIRLAYQIAREHFIKKGVNRVVLATDGDFNVGVTSHDELLRLIEEERKSGIFLSVLGVGTGNLKDATMEMLADKGNGNYSYLDSLQEARKVLVREAGSTLVTIAKDVKIQVEFNPQTVSAYRLIGYENRLLKNEDFNDDRKDAGEIGAGHSVTALYEIVPVGADVPSPGVDPLRYQQTSAPARVPTAAAFSDELMTVKLRFKAADGDTSRLVSSVVRNKPQPMTANIGFASAVAELGMLLRDSVYQSSASYEGLSARARTFRGSDLEGYRAEFIRMAELAATLRSLDGGSARAR
jgi:Ca-activated chloride channel family protein